MPAGNVQGSRLTSVHRTPPYVPATRTISAPAVRGVASSAPNTTSRVLDLAKVMRQDEATGMKLLRQVHQSLTRDFGPHQLEDVGTLRKYLSTAGTWGMVVKTDSNGNAVSGAAYNVVNGRGVIEYLWASPGDARAKRVKDAYRAALVDMRARFPNVNQVFISVADPSRLSGDEARRADDWLKTLSRVGFQAIQAPYAMASLADGKKPDGSVFLAVRTLAPRTRWQQLKARFIKPKNEIRTADVRSFVHDYFSSWLGKDGVEVDPTFQAIAQKLDQLPQTLRLTSFAERPPALLA